MNRLLAHFLESRTDGSKYLAGIVIRTRMAVSGIIDSEMYKLLLDHAIQVKKIFFQKITLIVCYKCGDKKDKVRRERKKLISQYYTNVQ